LWRNLSNRQAVHFYDPAALECSWVANNGWLSHHRLELENDLIAAHLVAVERIPDAQFLG
jgi:hypothetical protein